MRILCVSSHYPPNWTSGGTLVPHRCAVGLAQRGHEVHVFAGWIGEGRIDGEQWDEVDEHGIAIRWTAITGWTDWAHPANFENPAITVALTAHLQQVRPDIVHAHSLQGFGGAVITAARAQGIPTVVTTHDLGLAELVDELPGQVHPVHLLELQEGDRMTFDYRLRPGLLRSGNALALMRQLGLPV